MPGLNEGVLGYEQGDKFTICVAAADAYREGDEAKLERLPLADLLADTGVAPVVGCTINGVDPEGQPFEAAVVGVDGEFATCDFNHSLAGQDLAYDVEIVEVFGELRALWRGLRQDLSGK